ncbi:metal-dependent transcriptional regulator [Rothia halotolerans]|uniref:metal-dependent transcriptional regulator n=1 Tax=Rothia halotolerans TaxID=405770 RepID=UPI00101C108C|nr:metal-dependent transcriptional regulator [Rothia halotolerans]
MSVTQLSSSAQNYLKTIWTLAEWSDDEVTASGIAAATGLRLSSVSDAIRRLTSQGLLEHAPYGSVELTEAGRLHAVAMVRRHRLLETFLVEVLGYTWDQVHDEAEVLEHSVSDFMIERIDERLGHPSRDPHGDPIPAADGTTTLPAAIPLTQAGADQALSVERISDADPELLQFFAGHGIRVGTRLLKRARDPYLGGVEVQIDDGAALPLGPAATDALYVSRAQA